MEAGREGKTSIILPKKYNAVKFNLESEKAHILGRL